MAPNNILAHFRPVCRRFDPTSLLFGHMQTMSRTSSPGTISMKMPARTNQKTRMRSSSRKRSCYWQARPPSTLRYARHDYVIFVDGACKRQSSCPCIIYRFSVYSLATVQTLCTAVRSHGNRLLSSPIGSRAHPGAGERLGWRSGACEAHPLGRYHGKENGPSGAEAQHQETGVAL